MCGGGALNVLSLCLLFFTQSGGSLVGSTWLLLHLGFRCFLGQIAVFHKIPINAVRSANSDPNPEANQPVLL